MITVGPALLGRVLDGMGEPIDGKGEIKPEKSRPIEYKAPGVIQVEVEGDHDRRREPARLHEAFTEDRKFRVVNG